MKTRMRQGNWEALAPYARSIREAVFIQEQGVSADLEDDGKDGGLNHVVIFKGETPAATGRLDLKGKIGRVAVLRQYRRCGMGSLVMNALEGIAKSKGLETVLVHAQTAVIPFYQKLGYEITGEEFIEAGIPHRSMLKKLI